MKLREELTEEEVRAALNICAQEPIHIPGSIQPHGVLFAMTPNDGLITHASDNLDTFFGITAQKSIGRSLEAIIGKKTIESLKSIVVDRDLQPIQSVTTEINGRCFEAVAHMSGDYMVIELEPLVATAENLSEFFYDELRKFAIGMYRAETPAILYDHVVTSIRQLTGIDRVKLYEFDPEWNGAVVAEDRADFMTSYLGMRFPSSDIPEQARQLYMRNYLRLIADIAYEATPILASARHQNPLDLGLAVLRSVSPVHIQYLNNMGVRASMSISIIQNGKLWGLIACHHNSPKYLPYRVRMVAEIMGHIFSAQLSTFENHSIKEKKIERERLIEKMKNALDQSFQLDKLLNETSESTMEVMNAQGLILKTDKGILRYGDAPDHAASINLIKWLDTHYSSEMLFTNNVQSYLKGVSELESITGGLLSMPFSTRSNSYVIWLRKPIVEEVSWAGNPEKPLEETRGGYRLTPRGSFALWKQDVENKSHPWSDDDIETSRNIVNVFLEGQKLSAEHANIAKSEFLANMSHEIRTPMNAVVGLAHILAGSSPLTEKQRTCIRTLQLSADALLDLINDLLDIAKIEARTVELENIPFDLTQMTQEVISMMSVRVKEKGLEFIGEAEAVRKQLFSGDPGRIRQILLNLCSNAVKFTEAGSVHLAIDLLETDQPTKPIVRIIVKDTGIGIPEDKLDTIFQKFVQADNSITRKYGGTGLGLAITKMLVDLMGGTVIVETRMGKGSTFVVNLPLERVVNPPLEKEILESVALTGKAASRHRVLLVEDYAPNVLVATSFLEHFGYDWEVASNGVEAVEKANDIRFIAILMDVQMHGMNGFEATKLIREFEAKSGATRHVPIIGMTAHALAGDRERCIACGMDDYMAKPFDPDDLESKLADCALKRDQAPAL